jgi:O-antigen/teichoic acid export membrane protein
MNGSAPARTTAPREGVSRAGVAAKARTILASPMASRVLWRRSATAVGVYTATGLGFLTTVVATRELGTHDYARFAAVLAATGFFQLLLDLTIEEALVKYGFRYAERKSWGRLRRLFEVALAFKVVGGLLAGLALLALAPVAGEIWSTEDVLVPMVIASTIPLLQAPEGVAAGALILRGRYDIRGAFLAVSMATRLVGLAIGCRFGVTGGVLGMAVAQLAATAAVCTVGVGAFRRFPHVAAVPLAEDVRPLRSFILRSTIASSLVSARATLGTALLPLVAPLVQTGYFRNAQAPATGFSALSAPARLVLLTEQTRDFEAGRQDRMYAMLRRYVVSTSVLMLVAVPILWWLMPVLIGIAYGADFREHASDAARLVLIAAALQLVWGWSKSFPVSIGRPGLRVLAHAVEIAVFVPLLLVFAAAWGATGGAAAVLVSTVVFCALWTVLLMRVRTAAPVPA